MCCSMIAFDFEMKRIYFVLNLTVDLNENEGLWPMVAVSCQAIGVMSLSIKAGTEGMLGLWWQQSHCSRAEKGEPLLEQLTLRKLFCFGLIHSVFPERYQCTIEFPSSHETWENCFRKRRVNVNPCYGLFRYWQRLYFGVQWWWRLQWWSSENIRVSAQKTVFANIFGYFFMLYDFIERNF